MELMSGYKPSDVGSIPEDWDVVPLGQLVRSVEYGSAAKSDVKGRVPVLRMGNLQGGKIDWSDLVYTDDLDEIKKFALQPGDVLFNRTNTIDLVGKTSIYEGVCPAIFAGYLIRINVVPELLDSRFLTYILNTEFSRKYSAKVLSVAVGQANINGQKLKTYPIPLPPTKSEQEAIATALSDMDALTLALDRAIAKKRDLKQATMQQLLTGTTRLPGFSGVWDVKRLGQVLNICHGKSQRDVEVIDGTYPILATGGQIGTAQRPLYDKPSVLIGRKGTINQPQYMDKPFWTVDTLFYSVIKDENCAKFLYYRFCLIDWMQYNEASGVPSLNARTIESIEIACPEPVEQAAIAEVLSDMDAELITLETRRDKVRHIKQAVMQELLTGKTRLIAKEESYV